MSSVIPILLALALNQTPPADTAKAGDGQPPQFGEILDETKKLGPWEDNAKMQATAVTQLFEHNGWNSEEDRFAMNVMLKVGELPPWDMNGRQNAFLDAVGERYGLRADQKRELNRLMQRESLRFTLNHFSTVAPIAMEVLKTRGAGEPFTPEQVARWTKVIRPIAEEGRESIERVTRELSKDMTDEQREKIKRDMRGFVRRHRALTAQMMKWEQGEWRAEEWGLGQDPIQTGQKKNGEVANATAGAQAADISKPPAQIVPPAQVLVESEWERYVRDFGEKHNFSDSQRKSAQGILSGLQARAKAWRAANGPKLDELKAKLIKPGSPDAVQQTNAEIQRLESPVRGMFEELKQRLDALLTADQRKLDKPHP